MSNLNAQSSLTTENLPKAVSSLGINLEKAFELIGTVFPFELCLQHKIVPLNLVNESVILGMVNSQETSILKGVEMLVKSHNYLIKRKTISVDILKKVLSEYLKYKKEQLSSKPKVSISSPFSSLHQTEAQTNTTDQDESSTTLIIDNPQKLIQQIEDEAKSSAKNKVKKEPNLNLNLSFNHLDKPSQSLINLPSDQLLPELLARLIKAKVNQINIENLKNYGRISWLKNKESEVIIDQIPKPQLQTIINELKKILFLPIQPVTNIKKIESLRTYKNSKILLRLKIVPSHQGEQVFLYLFWGKMLKDYQDYQINRLSKEGMVICDKLEEKIKQIMERTEFYGLEDKEFPSLHQLQDKIYYQIESLSSLLYNHSDTLTGHYHK